MYVLSLIIALIMVRALLPVHWSFATEWSVIQSTLTTNPWVSFFPLLAIVGAPPNFREKLARLSAYLGVWFDNDGSGTISRSPLQPYHLVQLPFDASPVYQFLKWYPDSPEQALVDEWAKRRLAGTSHIFDIETSRHHFEAPPKPKVGVWCCLPSHVRAVHALCQGLAGADVEVRTSAHLVQVEDFGERLIVIIDDPAMATIEWHRKEAPHIPLAMYVHLLHSLREPAVAPGHATTQVLSLRTPKTQRPIPFLGKELRANPHVHAATFDRLAAALGGPPEWAATPLVPLPDLGVLPKDAALPSVSRVLARACRLNGVPLNMRFIEDVLLVLRRDEEGACDRYVL